MGGRGQSNGIADHTLAKAERRDPKFPSESYRQNASFAACCPVETELGERFDHMKEAGGVGDSEVGLIDDNWIDRDDQPEAKHI